MESAAHARLKQLAIAFLREHDCAIVADEVRCPISRFRVDVAGYAERVREESEEGNAASVPRPVPYAARRAKSAEKLEPRTIFIECKCSRADFIRDRNDRRRLLEERERLESARERMEAQRIPVEEPHLRLVGSSLFAEMDEWDFPSSRLPEYRRVMRRLRKVDQQLHGQTKFWTISRYALADRLYIAAPRGVARPRELPPGWGLLEASRQTMREADPNADLWGRSLLDVRARSARFPGRATYRQQMLRNIALAASRSVCDRYGVIRSRDDAKHMNGKIPRASELAGGSGAPAGNWRAEETDEAAG